MKPGKMKKNMLILCLFLLIVPGLSIWLSPDRTLSEEENRTLMTREDLSPDVRNGCFQKDLESFLSDQFPLREPLTCLQSGIRYLMGQREIGGAYICQDGRLIRKVTRADIDEKELKRYAEKINSLSDKYPVYVLYVPPACCVAGDLLPEGAPVFDYAGLYEELASGLGKAKTLDLTGYLKDAGCYYKTDHHWNAYGAYLAYTAFCDLQGKEARRIEEYPLRKVSSDFRGTLSSMVPVIKTKDEILLPEVPELAVTADGKKTDFYDLSCLEGKDKYNVFQGGNHGTLEIENREGNGKTLLILKDSFANSFVPYLVRDYSRIIMIDERYSFVDLPDFVEKVSPDEILVVREIIQ